ncbi:MAG: efflux transporter outer membrane subunit [Litorimonas sp.]
MTCRASHAFMALASWIVLSACASLPDRPDTDEILTETAQIPTAWTDRTQDILARLGSEVPDTVWEGFEDPALTALVRQSIDATPSAREAQARLILARTRVDLARARLRPTLSLGASATRERSSLEGPQFANLPPAFADQADPELDVFGLSASAAWEPDIWGRRALEVEAARLSAEAAEARADATLLSLQSDTARTYVQLRATQVRESLTRDALALLEETLQLTTLLREQDLASDLDGAQVRAAIEERGAELASLEGQRIDLALALATLTGQTPEAAGRLVDGPVAIPGYETGIPDGVPSTLLARRPDLRAASAGLMAARAQSDADDLNRLPTFSLTGEGGLISTMLDTLISTDARRGAIGAALGWPIFQGGALEARRDASDAEVLIAEAQYDAAVLRALGDVEGALSRYVASERAARRYETAIAERERIVALTEMRFRSGLESQFRVIETQTELLQRRIARADADAASAIAIIDLFAALGGEWR